jgi:hypothetical protein
VFGCAPQLGSSSGGSRHLLLVELIDSIYDVVKDNIYGPIPVDLDEYSTSLIELEKGLRLRLVHLEPVGDESFFIVRALLSARAGPKPLAQFVATDREMDDSLELDLTDLLRHQVGHFGLT